MIVRRLSAAADQIFLTFDDGPCPIGTPRVLEVLRRENVRATFFMIAKRAAQYPDLLKQVIGDGHSVGDHSLDHLFRNYFVSDEKVLQWLKRGREEWSTLGVQTLVGFRPPAGICPPPLARQLDQLGWTRILWSERFYDALWAWSEGRARRSAQRLKGGEIVLLHDCQSPRRVETFCRVLEIYIRALKAQGFELAALTPQRLAENSK